MERVAFLLEDDGTRIACLLNPASLVVRRTAGLRRRASVSGGLAGAGAAEDPWIATGGGTTEISLDLFFDTSIVRGSTVQSPDVRDWTRPLWRLAENSGTDRDRRRPPRARFLWGLAWNLPVVVAAIAERLEEFDSGGAPRRSWMRMRLLQVEEDDSVADERGDDPRALPEEADLDGIDDLDDLDTVQVVGTSDGASDQLFEIADDTLGDASLWRWIAHANDVDDPLAIEPGTVLRVPTLPNAEASQ